jgi:anti-anti-sigma factor
VQIHTHDDCLIAEFWDCLRLDPAPVQVLLSHFEHHLNRKGQPDLVIDLKGVGFAGSASLSGFLKIHRLASKQGGRLVFCNVDPMVHDVFHVSNIASLFVFQPDRDSALAFVKGGVVQAPEVPGKDNPSTPRAAKSAGPLSARRKRPPS